MHTILTTKMFSGDQACIHCSRSSQLSIIFDKMQEIRIWSKFDLFLQQSWQIALFSPALNIIRTCVCSYDNASIFIYNIYLFIRFRSHMLGNISTIEYVSEGVINIARQGGGGQIYSIGIVRYCVRRPRD